MTIFFVDKNPMFSHVDVQFSSWGTSLAFQYAMITEKLSHM